MFGFEVAGGFFNYEFYAHPVGTTFYHSHVSTQHEAGLSGLVHVRDPKDAWPRNRKGCGWLRVMGRKSLPPF